MTAIRDLRARLGMSQAALSRTTGIAPAQLGRYELGHARPTSYRVMRALAKGLRVPVKELAELLKPAAVPADDKSGPQHKEQEPCSDANCANK